MKHSAVPQQQVRVLVLAVGEEGANGLWICVLHHVRAELHVDIFWQVVHHLVEHLFGGIQPVLVVLLTRPRHLLREIAFRVV